MINATLNLLPQAVGQGRPQIIPAVIAADTPQTPLPIAFSDPLYVTSPTNTDSFWRVDDWPIEHGGTLPSAGAACALYYDSGGALRCVWWDGEFSPFPADLWLGMNGNDEPTGVFSGPLTLFQRYGLIWTRHSQVQGATNDGENGVPLLTDLQTADAAGFKSVVVLASVNYKTGSGYITGAAIATYAAWFVSQVQMVELALPGRGTLYEIDNEPWGTAFYNPAATAAQYADVVVAVLNAATAAGLDLTRIYPMIKDTSWVPAMYTEQPTLATLVQGWSMHPYGPPPPGFAGTGSGIASVPTLRQTITGSGADNILISEIGFQDQSISGIAGGGSTQAATSLQAGEWMSDMLEQAKAYHDAGWLTALLVYHRTDSNFAMVQVNTSGTLTAQGTALSQFPQRMRPQANQGYAPRAPGIYLPYDDGAFTVTMYPEAASNSIAITAGKLHLFRCRVDVYDFISHITVWVDGADAGLSNSFAGVYQKQLASGSGSYVLVASTADQSTAWSTTGRKEMSLTSGRSFVPGYYWIALVTTGNTTLTFRGVTNGAQMNLGNFGVLPQRVMQGVATGQTSLPSSLDLSSGSVVSGTAFTSGILAALN